MYPLCHLLAPDSFPPLPAFYSLFKISSLVPGSADGMVVTALGFHTMYYSSSLGPGGLKITLGVYLCIPKIPGGEWRRGDFGMATCSGVE